MFILIPSLEPKFEGIRFRMNHSKLKNSFIQILEYITHYSSFFSSQNTLTNLGIPKRDCIQLWFRILFASF